MKKSKKTISLYIIIISISVIVIGIVIWGILTNWKFWNYQSKPNYNKMKSAFNKYTTNDKLSFSGFKQFHLDKKKKKYIKNILYIYSLFNQFATTQDNKISFIDFKKLNSILQNDSDACNDASPLVQYEQQKINKILQKNWNKNIESVIPNIKSNIQTFLTSLEKTINSNAKQETFTAFSAAVIGKIMEVTYKYQLSFSVNKIFVNNKTCPKCNLPPLTITCLSVKDLKMTVNCSFAINISAIIDVKPVRLNPFTVIWTDPISGRVVLHDDPVNFTCGATLNLNILVSLQMTVDIETKAIEPNTSINVYIDQHIDPENIITINLLNSTAVQDAVCRNNKIQIGLGVYCGVVAGITEVPYLAGLAVCNLDPFDPKGCLENLYKTFPNNAPGWGTNCQNTCKNKIISHLEDTMNDEKNTYFDKSILRTQLNKIQTTIENLIKDKYPELFPPSN